MRSKYGKRGVPRALRKPAQDDRPGGSGMRDGDASRSRAYDGYKERPGPSRDGDGSPGATRAPLDRDAYEAPRAEGESWREHGARAEVDVGDAVSTARPEGRSDGRPVQVYWKPRRSVHVRRDGPDGGG
jgi:hypothetical protein